MKTFSSAVHALSGTAGILAILVGGSLLIGCSGDDGGKTGDDDNMLPDAGGSDAGNTDGCDPQTVLPTAYRPIATSATTAVTLTTTAGITTGSIDATAGGLAGAADNPYVYVDLVHGTKVDVSDITAPTNTSWDIALKRSSLRTNSGDSGMGGRTLAVVDGATSVTVTAPADGYTTDDFTGDDCTFASIPGGEPMSAFGEWYDYDVDTHAVTPKS
ncbi:MAG TPA: HmuY family protein, partial [Kofleriaceae bacterium]